MKIFFFSLQVPINCTQTDRKRVNKIATIVCLFLRRVIFRKKFLFSLFLGPTFHLRLFRGNHQDLLQASYSPIVCVDKNCKKIQDNGLCFKGTFSG